jgi:hypothetical protein
MSEWNPAVTPDTGRSAEAQAETRAAEAAAPAESSLTAGERATLRALLENLFPADELGPGAIEIGVPQYIEGALADAYRGLVPVYRRALRALDNEATRRHGRSFGVLVAGERDAIIADLEAKRIEELRGTDAETFFDVVWKHLREGLFSDPIHGGNRDMAGWRLIGFPGAQYGYTAEEQQIDAVIDREPRSVRDLRRR